MDSADFLTFFVNGFLIIFLMIGAIAVLARNPKDRLNRSFFMFYLFFSTGFLVNVVLRLLNDGFLRLFLIRLTIALITYAIVNLLIFNLILFFNVKFTQKHAWILIIMWAICSSVLLFLDWENGVKWVKTLEAPSGLPYWSTTYSIYGLALTVGMYFAIFLFTVFTKKKIETDEPKAKQFSKNLAILFLGWFTIGNVLNNWEFMRVNVQWFSLFMFYSSVLFLPAIILFWLSVVRKK